MPTNARNVSTLALFPVVRGRHEGEELQMLVVHSVFQWISSPPRLGVQKRNPMGKDILCYLYHTFTKAKGVRNLLGFGIGRHCLLLRRYGTDD